MSTEQHYTFGDNDLAAYRLRLLAEAYEPSSQRLLNELGGPTAGGAVDLGCGPGLTTSLVARVLKPEWTLGIDRSQRLLAQARASFPELRFMEHDVTATPFPAPPASVAYSRFLLTHLADPDAALRAWRHAVVPGGRLVLEETDSLTSDHPTFQRYYTHVERLQAHYRQRMHLGAELDGLCRDAGWLIERSRVASLEMPPEKMARLHALNIRTWSKDAFAAEHFVASELRELEQALDRVAAGEEKAPAVHSGMRQVVLRAPA